MRMGVISDIHGNLPALEAVLADMPSVDSLVCAGDVVGYNPWPDECVSLLVEHEVPTISGNHDRAVVSGTTFRFNSMATEGVRFAQNTLTLESMEWLSSLPKTREVYDGRVLVVHGHPESPDHYTYPHEFSSSLLADEDVLVMGHTHIQAHEVYDDGIVLNPGSVGQPRDGNPKAAYAVVDLDERIVEECRVTYDIDRVVSRIHAVGLPAQLASRLYSGH